MKRMNESNNNPDDLRMKTPYRVHCSICGRFLGKSYSGTATHMQCPKCKAELFYTVNDNGPMVQVTKGPKHQSIPA